MHPALERLWRDPLDIVFPRCCVDCGGLVDDEHEGLRHFCLRCSRRLRRVSPPHCTTCGHPFFGAVEAGRMCAHCEHLHPLFGEGRTIILLKGPGRALIHELKYHEGLHLAEDIIRIAAAAPGVSTYLRGAVLVPVPLHPRKLRERGYNQSRLLADCFAQVGAGGTRVEELLIRTVDTESQTHYDREERRRNLKNAFALAPNRGVIPAQRYVLVDDVFTTGSTLNACAAVLRRAGVLSLDVATLGHG